MDAKHRHQLAENDYQKLKIDFEQASSEVKNLQNNVNKMAAHIDPDTLTLDDVMQKLR